MTRFITPPPLRYPRKTLLRHHAGSVWQVIRYTPEGDYRIRCVLGTSRVGWTGGEVEGTVRQVHHDYLHGDGWARLAARSAA